MSMTETMRLFDLAGAELDRRFSPYCWRIRLALAHKNLPVETIPWRFTEKEEIALSGQTLVPVLVDGDQWIADSWTIANYLEDRYPNSPSLFGGPVGRSLSRHYSDIADGLVRAIFPFVVLDVLQHVAEKDRDYFRASREKRANARLETVVSDRDKRLPDFRASLASLRLTLKSQPFLGGDQPLYADYAVFGPFQWARCISSFALLEKDDPVRHWRDRLLDCFNGLGREAPAYDV
jgi:glutathione S-transferase